MSLPTINTIWIGLELGPIHVECLKSFLKHGHRVVLHVYEEPVDLPFGIELSDANELLPRELIFTNRKTGSYAPFSDLLRYELLYKGLGLYVDCDIYCLGPFPDDPYVFCESKGGLITNALLRLPPDDPVTFDLANMINYPKLVPPPPPYTKWRLIKWRLLRLTQRYKFDRLNTSALGPPALTYYLYKHGLIDKAMPRETCLPKITSTSMLRDPSVKLTDIITNKSIGIHLGNSTIGEINNLPQGCILKDIINGII